MSLFETPPNFVIIDNSISADLYGFEPDMFTFGVRAVEYDLDVVDPELLPVAILQDGYSSSDVRFYPSSTLRESITATNIIIPLIDVTDFPIYGIIRVGAELIRYTNVNYINNNIETSIINRGFNSTTITSHDDDGYDGYYARNSDVVFWLGSEEQNTKAFSVPSRWEGINGEPYNSIDGYRQRTVDLLTSDLSSSDELNKDFPTYDYGGYHRTDPALLLNGECVGSYIGGEQYCADGYDGVGLVIRGFNLQDQNNQRQEMLLSVTGVPVCLIRKRRTGMYCRCYNPTKEQPNDRCTRCLGTGFVFGWHQYFYTRRSDGRIMVRFSPADEDVKLSDAGLESELNTECWTLTYPTVKDRDVLVRFDQDGNEEFRYEVLSVNRNNTINNLQGGQKMRVVRVRKTDSIYQIPIFRDTSNFPSVILTTESSAPSIPLHAHEVKISEKITSVLDLTGTTSIVNGHSHAIIRGLRTQEVLGHFHDIYIPL
jgi:hypothetical protein